MAPNGEQPRIVVLGAGYTGMMAALRVARRTRRHGADVTIVNPSDRFTERLRMHQVATGQQLADRAIPDLLAGTGIRFIRGRATSIDADNRAVSVATDGGTVRLRYDYVIYAVGSTANADAVAGVDLHACTLDDPTSAAELRRRMAAVPSGGSIAVCGSGLTGVEAAAEIAESHPDRRVVLIGRSEPAAMMGPAARAYVAAALHRLGVAVRSGVEVTKVLPDAVELADGELVTAHVCLWTTGFWALPLAAETGFAVDERGRIVVDAALRSVSHPSVFAVGDAAAIRQPWGAIHGTCQSGMPTAVHAADAITRLLVGKPVRPFRFGYVHQPVSLGRHDAVIQFTRPDDTPTRWYLTGRLAVRYKELVSRSPLATYRWSRRCNVPRALVSPRRGGREQRRLRARRRGR